MTRTAWRVQLVVAARRNETQGGRAVTRDWTRPKTPSPHTLADGSRVQDGPCETAAVEGVSWLNKDVISLTTASDDTRNGTRVAARGVPRSTLSSFTEIVSMSLASLAAHCTPHPKTSSHSVLSHTLPSCPPLLSTDLFLLFPLTSSPLCPASSSSALSPPPAPSPHPILLPLFSAPSFLCGTGRAALSL